MDQLVSWLWRRQRQRFITVGIIAIAMTSAVGYLPYMAFIIGSFYGTKAAVVATLAAAVANSVTVALVCLWPSPELAVARRWMAGDDSDPREALDATFTFIDRAIRRSLYVQTPTYALVLTPFVWKVADLSAAEAAAYLGFHLAGQVTARAEEGGYWTLPSASNDGRPSLAACRSWGSPSPPRSPSPMLHWSRTSTPTPPDSARASSERSCWQRPSVGPCGDRWRWT